MLLLHKIIFYVFSLLTIILLINIYGCSSRYFNVNKYELSNTQQKILKKDQWSISGKISCKYMAQQWSTSFIWYEKHNYSKIRLIPFMISQQIFITQTPHVATILIKNQKLQSSNIDSIVFNELGWNIPFSKLKYWILGLPAPKKIKSIIIFSNNIQSINQDEWHVTYKDFYYFDNFLLPKKIFLKKEALEIKIIINKWSIQ